MSKKDPVSETPLTAADSTPPASPPSGGFVFTYRNAVPVLFAAVLSAFAVLQVLARSMRVPVRSWELGLGGALVVLGVSLRIWCILQIGGSARKTSRPKANRIISWGPYSFVRNPIYVANMSVVCGFSVLVAGIWALPPAALLLWLWYDAVVRREEAFLAASLPGDYEAYRRISNRWLPKLRYRRRPDDVPPYPFTRALRRERGHIIAVSVGAAAVTAFRLLV
jgi:protein-S-isoprenylcysteine O-methyltransferase Ste14